MRLAHHKFNVHAVQHMLHSSGWICVQPQGIGVALHKLSVCIFPQVLLQHAVGLKGDWVLWTACPHLV